ncbi:YicC/YloC family endoribonuclease [Bacillus weihaiensis]|uniref:YicC/YloC family endoribonuclease n=1 Tax=Bacillus weihaiensis TaxID=1547283 RepID=UPI000ABEE59E|nr:YicC/YloC family endoribonuclease [Bacillus weihaiensis]
MNVVSSMTGYGRASAQIQSCIVTVEIKTVNHRFLDVHLKIPKQFMMIEDQIKKVITSKINRGRVELFVNIEGEFTSNKKVHIDWDLMDQFVFSLGQLKEKYSIKEDISLQHLLHFQDGIEIQDTWNPTIDVEQEMILLVESAVSQLVKMREVEGARLEVDLSSRLLSLSHITNDLETIAPIVVSRYQEKLTKRVSEFVTGKIDENRIVTEVAIFADKADISEELTRIHSHLFQFTETLEKQEPIGRKLDFLVQELNREANTIGSKANDGLIAKNVVELKSIIEKLKEQVQNIE